MIEIGVLSEDEAIELLGGQLVVRQPELSPHATAVRLVDDRRPKGSLCARAGIENFWIDDVAPLAVRDRRVPVADLLP